MRTHTLVLANIFLVAHSHPLVESTAPYIPRDLVGLFDQDSLIPVHNAANTIEITLTPGTTSTLGGIAIGESKTQKVTSTTTPIGATHSIIGTLPAVTTEATQSSRKASLDSTSTTETMEIPTFSAGSTSEAARMPPGEAAEWKVIGLVLICLGFVATIILSIVFFDSWWGFLRDLACGKRRREGVEDMVPDWEKRSWEFKLASEDGHRYPTLASLDCITKEHAGEQDGYTVHQIESQSTPRSELTSPGLPYLPERDPHPLEPLFRRPSTRQLTPPQPRA